MIRIVARASSALLDNRSRGHRHSTMYAPRRFSCPNVFIQARTGACKIAEQRADRRTPAGSSTFIPIARTPMLLSAIIRFFHRCFQPHLDQMKHGAVNDPASYRLEKLRVRKRIKVSRKICVNDLSMSSVHQLMDVSYCIQCACVLADRRTVSGCKSGLEDGGPETNTAAIMTVRSRIAGTPNGAVAPRASGCTRRTGSG